jgi:hypothetical protein
MHVKTGKMVTKFHGSDDAMYSPWLDTNRILNYSDDKIQYPAMTFNDTIRTTSIPQKTRYVYSDLHKAKYLRRNLV